MIIQNSVKNPVPNSYLCACQRSNQSVPVSSFRRMPVSLVVAVASWIKFFHLKGQCHKIYDFLVFSWISFPQASEYTSTAFTNFFANSRRYSRLKVHHRCQRHWWQIEKIFKQKNCNNFVWAPLGSRVTIYINFCLQVHFKVSAAWYCSHYLPPVSTTPAANLPPVSLIPVANPAICRRCLWYQWQIRQFATGVVDTGGQICHRCQQHKGNWWQNLPPVSLIPVANLPPVSLMMQLLTGAEWDGNVISRVMTTLSLHRSTEVGRC